MTQLKNAARHPAVGPHVAVMPDCHVGYGVTIGCVLPIVDAVLPTAVGVDIACGVCAVRTELTFDAKRAKAPYWQTWADRVRASVPTGFSTHDRRQSWDGFLGFKADALQPLIRQKAEIQLGTLGGGNHFLEAQVDEENRIWLMVHSGSRHIGLRVADHYTKIAEEISVQRGEQVPKDLATLPLADENAQNYLADMEWATGYALESRFRMMEAMLEALRSEPDEYGGREAIVNIHHNFARSSSTAGRTWSSTGRRDLSAGR